MWKGLVGFIYESFMFEKTLEKIAFINIKNRPKKKLGRIANMKKKGNTNFRSEKKRGKKKGEDGASKRLCDIYIYMQR